MRLSLEAATRGDLAWEPDPPRYLPALRRLGREFGAVVSVFLSLLPIMQTKRTDYR